MARQLSDDERKKRLDTRDKGYSIAHFVTTATSAFYEDSAAKKPMKTVHALQAFSQQSPQASTIWADRLRLVEEAPIRTLLAEVPPNRLSGIGRDFTCQLLIENRRRILAGDDS